MFLKWLKWNGFSKLEFNRSVRILIIIRRQDKSLHWSLFSPIVVWDFCSVMWFFMTDNLGIIVNGSSTNSNRNGIWIHNYGMLFLSLSSVFFIWYQILEDLISFMFLIQTADIDEKGIRKEKPEELVMALAQAKVWLVLLSNLYSFSVAWMWVFQVQVPVPTMTGCLPIKMFT